MPGYFALPVESPEEPDINLPYGDVGPDGGATEFRVVPSDSPVEMVRFIAENMREIEHMLENHSGCTISVEPNYWMDPFYIERLPESFGNSCSLQILGCAPDFSVYNIDAPQRPDPRNYTYRTLGGHIHIGMGTEFMLDRAAVSFLVAGLDLLLGASGTYLCTSKQAFDRKKLYGQAGMVRTKESIVEYRTLPAQALVQTPVVCELMFETAQRFAGLMHEIFISVPQKEAITTFRQIVGEYNTLVNGIVPAINEHNVEACRELQKEFLTRLPTSAKLDEVVNELQRYSLPSDFALHGWETV